MKVRRTTVALLAFLALGFLVVGCGGGEEPQTTTETTETTAEPAGEGSLVATVNLDGEAPELDPFDTSGNSECGVDEVPDETVVVNDNGTLRNVVVSVKSGPDGFEADAGEQEVIDQENCRYIPHVTTVKAGETFEITDSDPQMHNVRGTSDGNQLFNKTTFEGQSFEQSFENPGVYNLECNVHPWMNAWVYVTDHGRASVTGENGEASLSDLPAGDYELTFWHEQYGSQTQEVTIESDQEASVSVSFSAS